MSGCSVLGQPSRCFAFDKRCLLKMFLSKRYDKECDVVKKYVCSSSTALRTLVEPFTESLLYFRHTSLRAAFTTWVLLAEGTQTRGWRCAKLMVFIETWKEMIKALLPHNTTVRQEYAQTQQQQDNISMCFGEITSMDLILF